MSSATVGLDAKRLVTDFAYFAEEVLGLKLWPSQRRAAASTKFITAIAAPRRTGKSTLVVAYGIWTCFREPGARVALISAAESSARDRVEEAQLLLARAAETTGRSTLDEAKTKISFANGSVLFSRPASPRAIRGLGQRIKLVAVDEASLVDESVWNAAMFLALDHKAEGARIVISDVPWGSRAHWYRRHFELGTDPEHPDVESFRWDYTVNPALDHDYLARQKDVMPWARYQSDVLGRWADDEAAMFGHDLLLDCAADFEAVGPDSVSGLSVVGGLDFGFQRDASALAVVSALPDLGLNDDEDRVRFIVCHTELHRARQIGGMNFVRHVASTAQGKQGGAGFKFRYIASERNGVGEMPTEELAAAIKGRSARCYPLFQTQETKQIAFGRIRSLMEDGRLVLPRGELLRALGSISAKITESGGVSITAISDGGTHADLAFALAAAMGPWSKDRRSGCLISKSDGRPWRLHQYELSRLSDPGEITETGGGIRLPARPFLADLGGPFIHRAGEHTPHLAGQSESRR